MVVGSYSVISMSCLCVFYSFVLDRHGQRCGEWGYVHSRIAPTLPLFPRASLPSNSTSCPRLEGTHPFGVLAPHLAGDERQMLVPSVPVSSNPG